VTLYGLEYSHHWLRQALAGGNFAYSISGDSCVQLGTQGNLDQVVLVSALICTSYTSGFEAKFRAPIFVMSDRRMILRNSITHYRLMFSQMNFFTFR
jgi:hypothetical protein